MRRKCVPRTTPSIYSFLVYSFRLQNVRERTHKADVSITQIASAFCFSHISEGEDNEMIDSKDFKERQQFYDGQRWRHLRIVALRRDRYLCQHCKRYGRIVPATEVHHIQSLEDRPDLAYKIDNLISLCHACHNKQHREKGQKGINKARQKKNIY